MDNYIDQIENLLETDIAYIIRENKVKFDEIAGPFSKNIVLAGAGELGQNTLAGLRKLGIEPIAFVDNNPDLWRTECNGLSIMSPYDAAQQYGGEAVFIVTIFNGAVVRQQLQVINCIRVMPFTYLYWRYPETFMPYGCLDLPQDVYKESNEVHRLLSLWADSESCTEYLAQIKWRLFLDSENMPSPHHMSHIYFPPDLISFTKNEVYVDCGAFDGANINCFIEQTDSIFKKIVAFEPDPENYERLRRYMSTLPFEIQLKIIALQSTIGQSKGIDHFDSRGTAASRVVDGGKIVVERISLDDILQQETPTYIKMDIEGAEMDALIGARGLIKQASAVWAICLYHKPTDLWQIPLFIQSVSDHYDFYLRRYAEDCWELILYAIPKSRSIKS